VGWSQASADFLEHEDRSDEDDNTIQNSNSNNSNGVVEDELICGFGNRRIVPVSTPVDRVVHPTTPSAALGSENSSSYFLGVLTKRLSKVTFWFKTLESETAGSKHGAKIDIHSSVGITRAIPIPNPIQ
jgi:hypothetical protein